MSRRLKTAWCPHGPRRTPAQVAKTLGEQRVEATVKAQDRVADAMAYRAGYLDAAAEAAVSELRGKCSHCGLRRRSRASARRSA